MKIIYLMHIDWNWIKQRPQFLAEYISKVNDVRVFSIRSLKRKGYVKNNKNKVRHKYLFRVPLSGRVFIFNIATQIINRIYFSFFIKKFNPDVIWLCGPELSQFIPRKYHYKFVYDCMDDHISFVPSSKKNKGLKKKEAYVSNTSRLIFVSSLSLKEKLVERYSLPAEKVVLLRNAFNGKIIEAESVQRSDEKFHIAYIGTISNWFDFDLLVTVTSKFSNLVFDLYGPIDVDQKVYADNNRIIFHGSIPHEEIYDQIKDCNALIMPFIVNELIKSVDPVKLYEYINYEKNIICIRYPEIERFEEFVHFYNNDNEFIEIIKVLMYDNKIKYNSEQKIKFLSKNSWESRLDIIQESLLKL